MTSPHEITRLLADWSNGDQQALEKLTPIVYEELRRLAGRYLRQERQDHTLQSTALVHEAYLKLIGQHSIQWRNRAQFFGVAAQLIRRILVDYARRKKSDKRGGQRERVDLDAVEIAVADWPEDLVALDEALTRLTAVDPRAAQLVHLRFFAGLPIPEAADVLGVSPRTADRLWAYARAWLHDAVRGADSAG